MITPTDNDDPQFIDLANQLLDAEVAGGRPAEVYVVCIDGWFDAKWLDFSGKVIGALGVHYAPIVVPPFHPHRVLAENHFSPSRELGELVSTPAPPLHIEQPSERNLSRFVSKISQSGVFFWYSSSSLSLGRGCTMLYRIEQNDVYTWYAAFHKAPAWRIVRHRGISPDEIRQRLHLQRLLTGQVKPR